MKKTKSSWKDGIQTFGRSLLLPIALLAPIGMVMGICSAMTQSYMIAKFPFLGNEIVKLIFSSLQTITNIVFNNIPLLFAMGVAQGMAKKEKGIAVFAATVGYLTLNVVMSVYLKATGTLADPAVAAQVGQGTVLGIQTLKIEAMGGLIAGLVAAKVADKFYRLELPLAFAFFGGKKSIPIITFACMIPIGLVVPIIWNALTSFLISISFIFTTPYIGSAIYYALNRALIPFGLHHVLASLVRFTEAGGTYMINGQEFVGILNATNEILFNLGPDSEYWSQLMPTLTSYLGGAQMLTTLFRVPAIGLAMYHTAYAKNKKIAKGVILTCCLTAFLGNITEPLEFSFLFVAPALFAVQVVLAGTAYMIAHMLNIAVGLTFSGGLLDFFLFGILQGNAKTSWMRVIPVGIIYFFLYYFIFKFMIKKFNFKTPGREDDDTETKLYTKADVNARREAGQAGAAASEDAVSEAITRGLGGKKNISDVDCCATRLRCTVKDASRVNDGILKATGASGVVHKGQGVQVIYGPNVTVIKSNLEDYLETAPDTYAEAETTESVQETADKTQEAKEQKVVERIVISSPITGLAADLATAPDEAFAQKMMGDGAVVTPEDPFVRAPEDGEVAFVFDTKHAIGFVTDSGISLLIHVGIDTVKLNGEGFEALVESGQTVKKGDPMLKLDLEYLKANAPSITSPVLCTELEDNQRIHLLNEGQVKAGEPLFEIEVLQ